MSKNRSTLGERIGDFLIKPSIKILETLLTTAVFAITGVVYVYTGYNLLMTSVYLAIVFLVISNLRYQAHKAEQRRLAKTEQMASYRRLTYERSSEVISPSQFSLFNKLNEKILSSPTKEEKDFVAAFVEELLEDLTTRVFEADVRASNMTEKWAGPSFKATLMVKRPFTNQESEQLSGTIEREKDLEDEEKITQKRVYQALIGKQCMFIKYWYYPGNAHPESLGTPYALNDGVAGLAWFRKSLVVWTPTKSSTPRLTTISNIFSEKYRGQQEKYTSMVCVPVESLSKEGKFLQPSDIAEDGVLGILTITCERKDYFKPEVDFAKYVQTLLAPYVAILSYALERA
jgi:hypothetical protein